MSKFLFEMQSSPSSSIPASKSVLNLANKIRLEAARRIVPLQSFSVAIPQFQAVFFLAVFVPEVVRFTGVPVGERQGPAVRNPEEAALFGQIGTGRPEMFGCKT